MVCFEVRFCHAYKAGLVRKIPYFLHRDTGPSSGLFMLLHYVKHCWSMLQFIITYKQESLCRVDKQCLQINNLADGPRILQSAKVPNQVYQFEAT